MAENRTAVLNRVGRSEVQSKLKKVKRKILIEVTQDAN